MRPSGVSIVDRLIGGLPPALPLVLEGPSGTGRTVLALALAHAALVRREPVVLLSSEPATSLLHQAESLSLPLDEALREGRLVMLELDAGAPSLARHAGLEPLISALTPYTEAARLVIVDPFSALTAEIADEPRLREVTRPFVKGLAGCDLVLTLESDRPAVQVLERVLGDLCGASLLLAREPDGRRTLSVDKTRSGLGGSERLEFVISAGGVHVVENAALGPEPGAVAVLAPPPAAPSPAAAPAQAAADAPARPRILVVEDDRLQRELIRDWLSPHYEVIPVADGFDALAALMAHKPDLVILDLILPRVTGYELLGAMRKASFDLPVLVASSRIATTGDRLGPLVLGATDFISKPLGQVELMHKVETLLRLPRTGELRFGETETQALFGSFSRSRLLEFPDFCERLGRVCDFGEKYGLRSTLVELSADSGEDLDRWIENANGHLRFEDAILRADKTAALALFVSTAPVYAPRVMERLAALGQEEFGTALAVEAEHHLVTRELARAEALEERIAELVRPPAKRGRR